MYQHILIPTDGSELADHAVTHGLSLAKSVAARVSVIVVEAPFDYGAITASNVRQIPDAISKHTEEIKRHATSVLERASEAAKLACVSYDTIQVEDAQPYEAIIKAANERGCDLIVMASHGRSGLSAVFLGSVTNKVLTHTKTPVLVCH